MRICVVVAAAMLGVLAAAVGACAQLAGGASPGGYIETVPVRSPRQGAPRAPTWSLFPASPFLPSHVRNGGCAQEGPGIHSTRLPVGGVLSRPTPSIERGGGCDLVRGGARKQERMRCRL